MDDRSTNRQLTTPKNTGDRLHAVSPPPTTSRVARIFSGVVFVGLLLAIPLAVIPYGTVDMWWEATFEGLIFVLTAIWIVGAVVTGDWQFRRLSLVLPMAAISGYIYVQAIKWPPKWLVNSATQHMLSIDYYQTMLTARKSVALT